MKKPEEILAAAQRLREIVYLYENLTESPVLSSLAADILTVCDTAALWACTELNTITRKS